MKVKQSVPRASIIWLARAVNVVRPVTLRLHIDRARSARDGRLGFTLGICTVLSRPGALVPTICGQRNNRMARSRSFALGIPSRNPPTAFMACIETKVFEPCQPGLPLRNIRSVKSRGNARPTGKSSLTSRRPETTTLAFASRAARRFAARWFSSHSSSSSRIATKPLKFRVERKSKPVFQAPAALAARRFAIHTDSHLTSAFRSLATFGGISQPSVTSTTNTGGRLCLPTEGKLTSRSKSQRPFVATSAAHICSEGDTAKILPRFQGTRKPIRNLAF